MKLLNKIKIARVIKMIKDLDKKLHKFITIPSSPVTKAFKNLKTLNQTSKVTFEEQ